MKILVTGAAGFIGRHLCRALAQKSHSVRALVMPGENGTSIEGVASEVVRGDLTQPGTIAGIGEGCDLVFHLAGRVTDWGGMAAFRSVNCDGTRNLLEACGAERPRFVYVSSFAACGLGRHLKGTTEDDEAVKSGVPYNDTKLDAEKLVASFCDREHLPYTIIRPANVIGPGSIWVRDVIDRYRGLFVPLIDGGRHSASLVYVDNLVDGMVRAGTMRIAEGRTYFFRDDWSVIWRQYLSDLGAMIGKRPHGSIPFFLAWYGGMMMETLLTSLGIRPPLTRAAAGLMGRDNDVDTTCARRELRWRTTVSYDEAMERIRRWVKETMT